MEVVERVVQKVGLKDPHFPALGTSRCMCCTIFDSTFITREGPSARAVFDFSRRLRVTRLAEREEDGDLSCAAA